MNTQKITRPNFDLLKPESIEPTLDRLLSEAREVIAQATGNDLDQVTWQQLLPVELDQSLTVFWDAVSQLSATCDSAELREVYNRCIPKITDFYSEVGQNAQLYGVYNAVSQRSDFKDLPQAAQAVISKALLSFRLAGVALPADQKEKLRKISSELADLHAKYGQNLLDDTKAWSKHLTSIEELAGVPERVILQARQQAESKGLEGYLLKLNAPTYAGIVSYAENEVLRREVYEGWVTRSSRYGKNTEFDNTGLMGRILNLRQEMAGLLGFDNYAQLALEKRMAQSTQAVLDLIGEIAAVALPKAKDEYEEVSKFAQERFGVELNEEGRLDAWNLAFYSEKLKNEKYDISDEELRDYFPIDKVLSGMFSIAERLFDVKIEERFGSHPEKVSVWHPDVRYFDVKNSDGTTVAGFYLDAYAREGKREGAWMGQCISRGLSPDGGDVILPVVYLVTNAAPPSGDKPALLSPGEVRTMFHEFGHGLHGMLTEVDYPAVAGTNVLWDAVELPSQLMENWMRNADTLPLISSHYQTGEALPSEILERMLTAANFQSALQCVRQLEFGLFDMYLHTEKRPFDEAGELITSIMAAARKQVAAVLPPAFNQFQNSFPHVFQGEYAAGYYCYKWAEALSADAFSAFEEAGILDRATGLRFRRTVLASGGSRDMNELFLDFRGRKPQIQPLLRQSGLL